MYEHVDFTKYKEEGRYVTTSPANKEPIVINTDIILKDITYSYPNTEKKILNHANMVVPYGKSIGIVGPSGAGKSTVVDIFLGLLQMQEGNILCGGRNVMDNYPSWLSHIGYIPQTIYLSDDSIRDNIAFGVPKEEIDDERIWHVLEEAQMKILWRNYRKAWTHPPEIEESAFPVVRDSDWGLQERCTTTRIFWYLTRQPPLWTILPRRRLWRQSIIFMGKRPCLLLHTV